jgi:hypothetical protein
VTADSAPTLPLTIVAATNDTLVYTPSSTSVADTFTIAPGIYTTLAALAAAVAASIGSLAGERFDTLCHVTHPSTKLVFTEIIHNANGSTITDGDGGAAALGFTANPDTFAGQSGPIGAWAFTTESGVPVIKQTDPLQTLAYIWTNADVVMNDLALQMDVRVDGADANGNAGYLFLGGMDPMATAPSSFGGPQACVFGIGTDNGPPGPTGANVRLQSPTVNDATGSVDDTIGTYHTVRGVPPCFGYHDGVLTAALAGNTTVNPVFGSRSRFVLVADGGLTFRNLKASIIPVPTL